MTLGDGEGGMEMTESLQLIREFCDRLIVPDESSKTRIVCFFMNSSHTQLDFFI